MTGLSTTGAGTKPDAPSEVSPIETGPQPHFADREAARAAGLASAEARRRAPTMTPEERALDAIKRKLPQLTSELTKAALGQGAFSELKGETRVAALKTLMEYGLGKPTAQSKTEPADDEPSGPTPESLFARPRIDPAAVSEQTA